MPVMNIALNTRRVRIENTTYIVPPNVQRIECRSTKGWQVRCFGKTKFFSDSLHGGPFWSLSEAVQWKLSMMREVHGRLPYGQGKAHTQVLHSYKKAA